MSNLTFTLIIPTRNRQRTAIHAIQSAINCRDPNLQIVVSDNSDTDYLRHQVRRMGWMDRVKYLKTDGVLSMRDNWEFALDHAEGEYISVIGDDDAVMPDCFTWARQQLDHQNVVSLRGNYAVYKWNDYPFPGRRQYLEVSFGNRLSRQSNPRQTLRDALSRKQRIGVGPGLYYGFVKREFLKELKRRRGRWLVDPVPDFDSGYGVLMYADSFAMAERNVFVSGHSSASNSGSMRYSVAQNQSINQFAKEAGLLTETLMLEDEPRLRGNRAVIVSAQLRLLP